MPITSDYVHAMLDAVTVGTALTPPTNYLVGLRYNNVEISATGSGYARLTKPAGVDFWTAIITPDGFLARVNIPVLTWPASGGALTDWGPVNQVAIWEDGGSVNPLFVLPIEQAPIVLQGGALTLAAGTLALVQREQVL